jgi:hypothetical protein
MIEANNECMERADEKLSAALKLAWMSLVIGGGAAIVVLAWQTYVVAS